MSDEDFDDFDKEVIDDQMNDLIDSLVKLKQAGYTANDAKDLLMEMHWATLIIGGALYSNGKLFECSHEPHDHDD